MTTIREAEDQAIKAGKFFGRVLEEHGKTHIATRVEGVTLVVAVGAPAKELERVLVELQPLGPVEIVAPPKGWPITLVPRYHAPKEEFARKRAYVHLHVLNGCELGRRVRKAGECLCSKKRGSQEREPGPGENVVCPECASIADEHRLPWSLG